MRLRKRPPRIPTPRIPNPKSQIPTSFHPHRFRGVAVAHVRRGSSGEDTAGAICVIRSAKALERSSPPLVTEFDPMTSDSRIYVAARRHHSVGHAIVAAADGGRVHPGRRAAPISPTSIRSSRDARAVDRFFRAGRAGVDLRRRHGETPGTTASQRRPADLMPDNLLIAAHLYSRRASLPRQEAPVSTRALVRLSPQRAAAAAERLVAVVGHARDGERGICRRKARCDAPVRRVSAAALSPVRRRDRRQ
mgnify:CR=1 FL=1